VLPEVILSRLPKVRQLAGLAAATRCKLWLAGNVQSYCETDTSSAVQDSSSCGWSEAGSGECGVGRSWQR
jgi:hypothetical protein